jgi:hypothetical protein
MISLTPEGINAESSSRSNTMRRTNILKTTFVAIIAVSAIMSATASAALPEFTPGAAGTKFTGKSGAGTLSTAAKGIIECGTDQVAGELIGTTKKEAIATITFKSCKAFGILGTKSLGDVEGTILAKVELELCYINKAKKEVGMLTELAETVHVEVAGKLLKISGDAVGAITPVNIKGKNFTITYKQKGGTQEPSGCEGKTENYEVQENETGPVEKAGEETTETTEFTIEQTLVA